MPATATATATTNAATPIRSASLDSIDLVAAGLYCETAAGDWYIQAEQAGRGIVLWLRWCVDRPQLERLIEQGKTCMDFAPENDDQAWQEVEGFQGELPDCQFFFCRYILSTDP